LEAGPADGLKTFYDSPYFQTLVSKSKIPRADFESSPKGIFNLLRDAAQQYISQEARPSHDFYVICLLNALFGDPRIHLIQLHPVYLRHNNSHFYDRAINLYGEEEYRDVKQSNECSKQRRNAVTELFRQICFIEYGEKLLQYQNKSMKDDDARLYEVVYKMLLNGQIMAAVKLLGTNGKNKLARVIAMSVSTQGSTKSRIGLLQNQYNSQGSVACFQSILDLITSREGEPKKFSPGTEWPQVFCSMLLYAMPTQRALSEVLTEFITHQ